MRRAEPLSPTSVSKPPMRVSHRSKTASSSLAWVARSRSAASHVAAHFPEKANFNTRKTYQSA
jgi:hypothetical protein